MTPNPMRHQPAGPLSASIAAAPSKQKSTPVAKQIILFSSVILVHLIFVYTKDLLLSNKKTDAVVRFFIKTYLSRNTGRSFVFKQRLTLNYCDVLAVEVDVLAVVIA